MIKKFLRGINVSLLLLIIISTFSSCANEMNIFEGNNNRQINFYVSIPEWKNIHPMLKIIPVKWNYTIPFGIMYSKQPSNDVQYFLNKIKELQPRG